MKNSLVTVVVLALSFWLGLTLTSWIKGLDFTDQEVLFEQPTSDQSTITPITWKELLPEDEIEIIRRYQNNGCGSEPCDPVEQITRSINAANDKEYLAAMYSTRLSEKHLGKKISIPGFIVPLDVSPEQTIERFFLVPYFGACLHYPPPAPNQIIMVTVRKPINLPDIFNPYSIEGVLTDGLYEDILGTSAYLLELEKLETYSGEPDDVRTHSGS